MRPTVMVMIFVEEKQKRLSFSFFVDTNYPLLRFKSLLVVNNTSLARTLFDGRFPDNAREPPPISRDIDD